MFSKHKVKNSCSIAEIIFIVSALILLVFGETAFSFMSIIMANLYRIEGKIEEIEK